MLNKKSGGFTLIELIITIVILVILTSIAFPSFVDTIDRRRVINATSEMVNQIQLARSISIVRNVEVELHVQVDNQAWCVGLTDDLINGCNCFATEIVTDSDGAITDNTCTVGIPELGNDERIEARILSANFPGVVLKEAQTTPFVIPAIISPIRFEPTRGMRSDATRATDASYTFESNRGIATTTSVNIIGRVSTCSPTSDSLLGGISPCL